MKKAQSIWEYLLLPAFSGSQRRTSLSEREALTMYEIFKSDRDRHGKMTIPSNIDSRIVSSLTAKGFLQNDPSRITMGNISTRPVEFTEKGRNLVRSMILHTETSAFEDQEVDRERVIQALTAPPPKTAGIKTASRQEMPRGQNWLTRAMNNGTDFTIEQ